jgi:hypothetical protein
LLHGGERSEGNDKNARVQFGKFVLLVTQLCDMLAAGYSAKVTEKDQQGVSVFENFAKGDLFAIGGGEGEGGGGGVEFHGSGFRWDEWKVVSGEW